MEMDIFIGCLGFLTFLAISVINKGHIVGGVLILGVVMFLLCGMVWKYFLGKPQVNLQ